MPLPMEDSRFGKRDNSSWHRVCIPNSRMNEAAYLQVRDVMEPSPVVIAAHTRVREAQSLMCRNAIRHLPVVEDGSLVGLLTEGDLRQAIGLGDNTGVCRERLDWPVAKLMTDIVIRIGPEAALAEAVELLVETKVGAIPVTRGERVLGILSYIDVLQALRPAARPKRNID